MITTRGLVVDSPQLLVIAIAHNFIYNIQSSESSLDPIQVNWPFFLAYFSLTNGLWCNHMFHQSKPTSKNKLRKVHRHTAAHQQIPFTTRWSIFHQNTTIIACQQTRKFPPSHKKFLQDTFSWYKVRGVTANHVFCQVCAWRAQVVGVQAWHWG